MSLRTLFSRLFGLFLMSALLLSSIQSVVFSHSFYRDLYERLDLASQIQVSQEDLEASIFLMTDYVEGKREDLEGTIFYRGQVRPVFNSKEIRHMKDVRSLWRKAGAVMIFSWIFCMVTAVFFLLVCRLQGLWQLYKGIKWAGMVMLGVVMCLGVWCLLDFTGFWTWFHTVVFVGNTDWLLDPATDFMIVICPEAMFSTMIFQIVVRFLAALLPVAAFGILCERSRIILPLEKISFQKGNSERSAGKELL